MFIIEEEQYSRKTGQYIRTNQDRDVNGNVIEHRYFSDAQRIMMNYAKAMGRIAMVNPDGHSVFVVDTRDGENNDNYLYIITEKYW